MALELDDTIIKEFKDHSNAILDTLNNMYVKDTLGRVHKRFGKRTSLMFLVTSRPNVDGNIISVGHMSQHGSFIAAYNKYPEVSDYIKNNMAAILSTIYDEYKLKHPKNRVLYLRYNRKIGVLEMFRTSGCVLTSRVYSEN